MTNTLQWSVRGESFEDGSLFRDWNKIAESGTWHWQYDTHELTFDIYEHGGAFWKLFRARYVPNGVTDYAYDFGGQACRMALVEYTRKSRSPHSATLRDAGDQEWVRTYEVDPEIHKVLKTGSGEGGHGKHRAA